MSSSLVCYTIGYNYVTSSNQYFPCGNGNTTASGAQSCCYAGDYCMEDNICHYTHSVTNGTGYYMAGCTDPTWQDSACPKQCTSEYGADVIYDTTNDNWNCCVSSEGYLNCQEPSDFIVDAPSPDDLVIVKQLNTPIPSLVLTTGIGSIQSVSAEFSGTSEATTTSSSSPSSTSSTSSTSSPSISSQTSPSSVNAAATATSTNSESQNQGNTTIEHSTDLSGGAKAGVAVACVVGALLIALLAFYLLRRRRAQKANAERGGYGGIDSRHGTPHENPAVVEEKGIQKQPTFSSVYGGSTYVSSNYAPSEVPISPEHTPGPRMYGYEMQYMPGSEMNPQELAAQRDAAELPASKHTA